MQIILLSGGSGKRLWPLSNDTRSKQFLKLLADEKGGKESMVQRVVRQLRESGLGSTINVATSISQKDVITNQLGNDITVITEPERRRTFPAIALSSAYLAYEKQCPLDETIVVMPCDTFTGTEYFDAVKKMVEAVECNISKLVLMGVRPTYPSAKYGYIVPEKEKNAAGAYKVNHFTEKPTVEMAEKLLAEGALWNGGVFAFRLGYLTEFVKQYVDSQNFEEIRARYNEFPGINFDYEVVEKEESVTVIPFSGEWKDLGTWNTLTDELKDHAIGNVILDNETRNTHVINELELPLMCLGVNNLVIAASNDGILVSEKSKSENIKTYANMLKHRPMFEERRWGEYKVVDMTEFPDGYKTLTKQLIIRAGKHISYQIHHHRTEVWTFIDGEGELILDDVKTIVKRGDTVCIKKEMKHAVRAITDLRFIEVQSGDLLIEEDIERFDWDWENCK